MNKKSYFAIFSAGLVTLLGIATFEQITQNKFLALAEDSNYSITLDSTNKPTIEGTTASLKINDHATISYTNVSATQVDTAHVRLDSNGTITKTLASYDLKSIVATFSGDLTITTGYTQETMDNVYKLTSGVATSIKGNYFTISTSWYAIVNQLTINYDCETADVELPGISSYIEDYNLNYLSDDKGGAYGAGEFNDALNSELGIKLPITLGEITNQNKNYIQFKTSVSLQNKYTIERNDNVITLASYDAIGLVEAAKVLFARLQADDTNLDTWYTTPVEGTYTTREKVSMMSFNVRTANDGTRPNGHTANITNREPRIIACINTHMPDSVGVQEANDTWITALTADLAPQYGYIGYGRESTYKGESSGIYYNRDTLTLLKSETKWLSETPDVAGSAFSGAQYKRIFTYGLFERKSDGYIYMHINTHLDLDDALNYKDALNIEAFAKEYKDKVPVFITGDFNASPEQPGLSYDAFINDFNWVDSSNEAIDWSGGKTFSQEGYNNPGSNVIIDFCLKANPGLYFTKYLVDQEYYSGDGVEKPQVTSDHYPVYCEAIPYEPIIPYTYEDIEEKVEIDNGFAQYDKQYTLVANKSDFNNVTTVLAANSARVAGGLIGGSTNYTKYNAVNSTTKLTYAFNSNAAGKSDLALSLAHASTAPQGTTLKGNIKITLNGTEIDLGSAKLRCTDIRRQYEWEVLVLRDMDIKEGRNELIIAKVGSYMPDHLLLDVFSDTTVEALSGEVTNPEMDTTNKIIYGDVTTTVGEFNLTYTNLNAVVTTSGSTKTLTITTKPGTTTEIPTKGGYVNFSGYNTVVITGGGKIHFTYAVNDCDALLCNSVTIDEGSELGFIKTAATRQGTGIKCNQGTFNINGTLTISKFNYGFGGWKASETPKAVNIGKNGTLSIQACGQGMYSSSSAANITSYGTINITTSGQCINYPKGAMTCSLIGDSVTNLSGTAAIIGAKKLVIGSETTTTNATFTFSATGSPVDIIDMYNGGNDTLIFNTLGKVSITGNANSTGKTCIKFYGGDCALTVKCADFSISGYQNAFGSWKKFSSYTTIYEDEAPYAPIRYSCSKLYSNTVGGSTPAYWELFLPLEESAIKF